MGTRRHLQPVTAAAAGVATAEALASFLRHLAGRRGRSGQITSAQTVRSYTSALPTAFTGIADLGELSGAGRERLHANIRTAWGHKAPATFNAKRAAVASALAYFQDQDWIDDAAAVLAGLDREHQPKPTDGRVRTRGQIEALIIDKRRPLEDRTLWSMLYATAARAEEVLRLNVEDLDRANRRARTIRKGGAADDLLYDVRTARMLGQLLGQRRTGPVFLSTRRAPEDGTALDGEVDPVSRRRRMSYRTADRHLAAATGGWDLHDLRHSRLTHAGEDGATEADLMNLSGHQDRRTLQRYLAPSKEGTHRRLDAIDAQRGTWTPTADELAARMATPPPTGAAAPEPTADDPAVVGGEPGEANRQQEWEQQAERERRQFEARLKPVEEFGEGYQMAEWPGSGRYFLVYEGQRIGHAVKKAFTSRWEARTAHGATVPGTSTYGTRREALIQVALHHQRTS
jgi:integrase/recombinase XerC